MATNNNGNDNVTEEQFLSQYLTLGGRGAGTAAAPVPIALPAATATSSTSGRYGRSDNDQDHDNGNSSQASTSKSSNRTKCNKKGNVQKAKDPQTTSKMNHARNGNPDMGPHRNIQPPKFSRGVNIVREDLVNRQKREQRRPFSIDVQALLKGVATKHVEEMTTLVAEIEGIRGHEDFCKENEKLIGILNAKMGQFHEMEGQYKSFNKVKSRAEEHFRDNAELQPLLQREAYRLKNRLPSLAKRCDIEEHLSSFLNKKNGSRFLIIQGATGSGKSTQVSQYLADFPDFLKAKKKIVCTQPRKIAAISLTKRVAVEYAGGFEKAKPGIHVGYQVGGSKVGGSDCRIEFVTEGVMLERIMSKEGNKDFEGVGCIVIDEAHERSITCDILLGSFKKADPRWKDIYIVVTSATIDIQEFSAFFDHAPGVEVPGKLFPIDKYYSPLAQSDIADMMKIREAVVRQAMEVHRGAGLETGDILCFLPGQEDVLSAKEDFENAIDKLWNAHHSDFMELLDVKVYSLYGRQDPEQQEMAFEKLESGTTRKVIFATDVAETSITIDGVVFVVDSGVRKEMVFDPKKNISTLRLNTISKSSATQRAGRSGRTQPGECYCLYSVLDFDAMSPSSPPEVFRKPLSLAALSLMEMKIFLQEFEWISAPSKEALKAAEEELRYLGAVDSQQEVTPLGKMISKCQQEPKLVRMIYRGCQQQMGDAAVTIAAIFTVSNMFFYNGQDTETRKMSRKARNDFAHQDGDVVTMYRVFQKYLNVRDGKGECDKGNGDEAQKDGDNAIVGFKNSRKRTGDWCRQNFVNGKAVGLIVAARTDFLRVFRPSKVWREHPNQAKDPSDKELRQLVFAGYFLHSARLIHSKNSRFPHYFAIHPQISGQLENRSSLLNLNDPTAIVSHEWIVYEKILRLYTTLLPIATPIEFSWLAEESPEFYKYCLEMADKLPTEKVLHQTSQEVLRLLLGRYFVNLPAVEEELGCSVDVDLDTGIIAAYCSKSDKFSVDAKLKSKLVLITNGLSKHVIEEEYLGGTRVLIGQGYVVKEVLFAQEYITVLLKSFPPRIPKKDVSRFLEDVGILEAIRNFEIMEYETSSTVRVTFNSKSEAKAGFEILKECKTFNSREIQVVPAGLGGSKGIKQEENCTLKLSWSLGPSEGKCQIAFSSPRDANGFIDRVCALFPGAKVAMVHGDASLAIRNPKRPPPQINKALPPAIVIPVSPGMCRFRFLDTGLPDGRATRFEYKVTVVDLPKYIDEQGITQRIKPAVPIWVKITRTMIPESNNEISDDEVQEKLKPLQAFRDNTTYVGIHQDRNLMRTILSIRMDDNMQAQKAFKLTDYTTLGDVFGQPHQLEMEHIHTFSVNLALFRFLAQDVQQIVEFAYTSGAKVSGIPRENTNLAKRKFVHARFATSNPKLMKQIQEKLEAISTCTIFHHEKISLLFTRVGNKMVTKLNDFFYLNWNAKNYGLYIYGNSEVQKAARKELKDIIENLSPLEVFDKVFTLCKRKVDLTRSNDTAKVSRICASSGIKFFDFNGRNKLVVSGSMKAVEKLKTALAEQTFLFEKQPTLLTKFRGRPECSVCLCEVDGDFIRSSLCPHAFCVACIQPWFDFNPPQAFPVECLGDGCNVLLAVGDICKMSKKEALRKFVHKAALKYQEENANEITVCPKMDCYQLLSSGNKTIGEYGGEFYFCDECVTTYCLPCSKKVGKSVKSHEQESCDEARNGPSDEVLTALKEIRDDILTLNCPRCKQAFLDFDGCAAIVCACGAGFCGICLQDCGSDAHGHVRNCSLNPKKNEYYISKTELDKIHRATRISKLKEYAEHNLNHNLELKQQVFRALNRDLLDLHISSDTFN